MEEQDIDVVGYFDFGSGTGAAPTQFAERISDRNRLGTVFCRGVAADTGSPQSVRTAFPFGNRLPQLVGLTGRLLPRFESRLYMERVFDRLTSRKVGRETLSSDIHYHHTPGHLRSLRRANEHGMTTVLAGAVELTQRSIERYEQECICHDIDGHIPRELRRTAARRLQTLKACNRVMAMSSFAAESYIEAGVERSSIEIVPLGVDTDRFSYASPPADGVFRVTFIGSVNILKGIPYLLKAWEETGFANDDDAELRLCGAIDDDIEPMLRAAPSNVSTPGFVDPVPEYRNASVFVFPTLTEGFAKAPLEAMSTGRPVIVTENAGTPDIMADGREGIVIPPNDVTALATALGRLRVDSEARTRMGHAARETAEKYTWDRYATTLLERISAV